MQWQKKGKTYWSYFINRIKILNQFSFTGLASFDQLLIKRLPERNVHRWKASRFLISVFFYFENSGISTCGFKTFSSFSATMSLATLKFAFCFISVEEAPIFTV